MSDDPDFIDVPLNAAPASRTAEETAALVEGLHLLLAVFETLPQSVRPAALSSLLVSVVMNYASDPCSALAEILERAPALVERALSGSAGPGRPN